MFTEREQLIKELKRCILCGGCKFECPTYHHGQRESLSPRGRLRIILKILTGELEPTDEALRRVYSCFLCGACTGRCSAGVQIEELLIAGRISLRSNWQSRPAIDRALPFLLKHRVLSASVARKVHPLLKGVFKRLGIPQPSIPPVTDLFARGGVYSPHHATGLKGRVVLFGGCAARYIQPHLISSFIRVLNAAGYEVVLPPGEACCGAPLIETGNMKTVEGFAEKNLSLLRRLSTETIVTLCPTCALTLSRRYEGLFGEGVSVIDSAVFLNSLDIHTDRLNATAYYHQPCHARYGLGIKDEPIMILEKLGINIKGGPGDCCGLPAITSNNHWGLSESLKDAKKTDFEASGATVMVTGCPGCMYQLGNIIGEERVLHIVEVMDEAITKEE